MKGCQESLMGGPRDAMGDILRKGFFKKKKKLF